MNKNRSGYTKWLMNTEQKIPKKRINVFVSCLAVIFCCLLFTSDIQSEQQAILGFIPEASEFKGWKWASSPKLVNGMELFAVINGEAERYLRHGCIRSVFVTYQTPSGQFLDVGIFEMKNRNAAKRILNEKVEVSGEALPIGDQAIFEGYYLNFRRANFQVTISGSDPDKTSRKEVIAVAEKIAARMKNLR